MRPKPPEHRAPGLWALSRALLVLGCVLAPLAPAGAAEFRSVAEDAAVLYDAPSRAATPLYVVARHYPLEVIVNLEAWVKVRDHTGALSWVEKQRLSDRRMVVVTVSAAQARTRAEDDSPVAFVAAQNVALELVQIGPPGWLRVRHADGADGFVRLNQVWGG